MHSTPNLFIKRQILTSPHQSTGLCQNMTKIIPADPITENDYLPSPAYTLPPPVYHETNSLDDNHVRVIKFLILLLSVLAFLSVIVNTAVASIFAVNVGENAAYMLTVFGPIYLAEIVLVFLRVPFFAFFCLILMVGVVAACKEHFLLVCTVLVLVIIYFTVFLLNAAHSIGTLTIASQTDTWLIINVTNISSCFITAVLLVCLFLAYVLLLNRIQRTTVVRVQNL